MTFLKRLVLVTSLAVLVIGCGKEVGKKNGLGVAGISPYADAQSGAEYSNVAAWYTSNNEGPAGTPNSFSPPLTKEVRQISSSTNTSSNSNCTQQPIKIFGTVIGYTQICTSDSSAQNGNQVTNVVTPIPNGYPGKANNARLARIFNGSLGQASSVIKQGSGIYRITLIHPTTFAQSIHVIDTNVNSAFNPVSITDYAAQTQDILVNML